MFRAIIYQRSELNGSQVADIGIVSASIKEDKTQKANSKITCQKIPTSVNINDLLLIYNNKGIFVYWGVITGIDDKTITCSQFESLWNDNEMIVAQTSTNQKAFFNNRNIADVIKFYLSAKSKGYANIVNTMDASYNPTFIGLLDTDVANNFKGVEYVVTDSVSDHMPYPTEKSTINLESFIYDTYNTYNRIIRPHFVGSTSPTPSPFPSGYTEVEYIQNNASGYVITNLKDDDDYDELYLEFKDFASQTGSVMGASSSAATGCEIRWNTTSSTDYNNIAKAFGYRKNSLNADNQPTGNGYYRFYFSGGDAYIDLSGNSQVKLNGTSNLTGYKIALFGRNGSAGGSVSANTKYKLVRFWAKKNGAYVCDYVPCKRDSDSNVGLYDIINGTYVAGSGLIAGSPVSPVGEARKLKVECFYPSGIVNNWDYNSKSLFDTWERISNLSITKTTESVNSVYVYSSDGTTLRGAYTIKNDGTIVAINGAIANRLGWNKTSFIYDDENVVLDLAKAQLPSLQYNHKISFSILFGGEYTFSDFNLGMPIKFYSTSDNHLYDSCLSGWEYSIKQNSDDIISAKFILGKVRSSLTSKLNKNAEKK